MTETEFIDELIDILELEEKNVTLETPIFLDSLSTLSIIAFLDQNFSKKATANELREVSSINDILLLAGKENIQ